MDGGGNISIFIFSNIKYQIGRPLRIANPVCSTPDAMRIPAGTTPPMHTLA